MSICKAVPAQLAQGVETTLTIPSPFSLTNTLPMRWIQEVREGERLPACLLQNTLGEQFRPQPLLLCLFRETEIHSESQAGILVETGSGQE